MLQSRPPRPLALVHSVKGLLWVLALGVVSLPMSASGQSKVTELRPIQYALEFPAPHTHYVEVQATFPTAGRDTFEVFMATWTPGSYLVRDYSRHVEELKAFAVSSGLELETTKSAKNRWRISNPGRTDVTLRYRVYGREMSVRTNWIDESFAMLNGAPTFLSLVGELSRPHRVRLTLPEFWARSVTGLSEDPSGVSNTYLAPDYDTLVDSPILVGNPEVYRFEVDGTPHYLANIGEGGVWDGQRSAADVKKIVEEQAAMWKSVPYDKYVFLNVIAESGGGLEHGNSTLMLTSRWSSRVPERYRRWLGLVSHEFFHTWNVKRLRPRELGPFDYEREVYTPSLWIVEGLTSYYDDLSLVRSGLITEKQYLNQLSRTIKGMEGTAGRRIRSLALASYDAWIRHYRPDENSKNTTISYYTKGAVVGLLLDAEIRRMTDDANSLDDVMRLAYERYSGDRGYTPTEFYACATEIAGQDLTPWFQNSVESTQDLSYETLLAHYGLRFSDPDEKDKSDKEDKPDDEGDPSDDDEADEDEEEKPKPGWLGIQSRDRSGRLEVSRVDRETPAFAAGFNVGDEILAIDQYRVLPGGWADRLKQYRPGESARVLIARRELLLSIEVTFAEKPADRWKLKIDRDAPPEAAERRKRWLASTRQEAG